jgi:hypothetical protein
MNPVLNAMVEDVRRAGTVVVAKPASIMVFFALFFPARLVIKIRTNQLLALLQMNEAFPNGTI